MDPLTTQSRDELLGELARRHRELLREGERFELVAEENARGVRGVLALTGGADGTRTEMEARVDFKGSGLGSEAALGLVLDALDLSFGEYLEAGRSERLNAASEARELDGQTVYLRGRVRRPALEAEASRLLGEADADEWT
jgi:hypothetical protein